MPPPFPGTPPPGFPNVPFEFGLGQQPGPDGVTVPHWFGPPPPPQPATSPGTIPPTPQFRRSYQGNRASYRLPIRALLAPPIVGTAGSLPKATIVRPLPRPVKVRQAPPSTTLPTVTFIAPVLPHATVASLVGFEGRRRRFGPVSTLLPPAIVGQSPQASVQVNQAVRDAVARRRRGGGFRLAGPVISLVPPQVQEAIQSGQALRRPYIGRTVPKPHLARPVLSTTFVAPPATIVSNHVLRRRRGGVPPSTILPQPTFLAPAARYANIVSLGAVEHNRRRRSAPLTTLLPPAIVGQPPGPSIRISQARQRAYVGRTVPKPHLALPIVGTTPVPAGSFLYQAIGRAYTRRTVPKPHLAGAALTTFVAPLGTVVTAQAVGRSTRRPTLIRPHLAGPVLQPKGPGLTVVGQALRRPYVGRTVPRPHLAGPAFATFVAPPATIITDQSIARALRGRSGHVRLPYLGSPRPVPEGTFVSQALQRPYVGRRSPKPYTLARPIVGVVPVPYGTFVDQSLRRPYVGRTVPKPHLATPVPGTTPVPYGTFVGQSLRRPYLGRTVPGPHLAQPLVGQVAVAPVAPGIFVTDQAVWRSQRRPAPPKPHLAGPVLRSRGPGITAKYQATKRALIGRTVPKPHLAGPTLATFVAPQGVFVSQALRAPFAFRRQPEPHLPPAIVGTTPVPYGTFVSQAIRRPYVGRVSPRPHILPSAIVGATPVPYGTFVGQSLRRPYIGRTVPGPHLAQPVRAFAPLRSGTFIRQAVPRSTYLLSRHGHVFIGAKPVLQPGRRPPTLIVSQALLRPYIGRKVIPPHLPKLGRRAPFSPGKFTYQAVRRRYWIARTVPLHPRLAPPIVAPFAPPAPIVPVAPSAAAALTAPLEAVAQLAPFARTGFTYPGATARGLTAPGTNPGYVTVGLFPTTNLFPSTSLYPRVTAGPFPTGSGTTSPLEVRGEP